MRPMETLGLSDSTPRSENRLKSLFWPSVESGADVDYLGAQGYWVCTLIAIGSLIMGLSLRQWTGGIMLMLFYYLGGVGVRERSRYAAFAVFILFTVEMLFSSISVVKLLFAALLLSNVRATWIAATWNPDSEEAALPPRLNQTLGDKFADIFPRWLWPKVQLLYYAYSVIVFIMFDVGMAIVYARRHH